MLHAFPWQLGDAPCDARIYASHPKLCAAADGAGLVHARHGRRTPAAAAASRTGRASRRLLDQGPAETQTTAAAAGTGWASEALVPAIARGLCVPFAPQASTRCFAGKCASDATAFQICFAAWAPGAPAGPVAGNVSIVTASFSGLLATFESGAGLGPGVFLLTWFKGSSLAACGGRRGLLGVPTLTVNETCGAGTPPASAFLVQVSRGQGNWPAPARAHARLERVLAPCSRLLRRPTRRVAGPEEAVPPLPSVALR